jgi:hypothetical protein
MFTGKHLIDAGYKPNKNFKEMINHCNQVGFIDKIILNTMLPLTYDLETLKHYTLNIEASNKHEENNLNLVKETMDVLMKTPMIVSGTLLPDACPVGSIGTIPVGGVVSSKAIHPGLHSADVCCSVFVSFYKNIDPKTLLDTFCNVTHFGAGGRDNPNKLPDYLYKMIMNNPITSQFIQLAQTHFCTQGDGNHFAYVGRVESNGHIALVTHHGSRGFGAAVYKHGLKLAQKYTKQVSPKTLAQNSWIEPNSNEEYLYWDALQIVREWTKQNHYQLHQNAFYNLKIPYDMYWNEHNFVFKKQDNLYYHAKGATPAFDNWAKDSTDYTLIPLNMAEPILITKGLDNPDSLGFSPHGAGRNFSRTQFHNMYENMNNLYEKDTQNLDIRTYKNLPDYGELPSAYKNADNIINQINKFKLATIVDKIQPYGSIMAGKD